MDEGIQAPNSTGQGIIADCCRVAGAVAYPNNRLIFSAFCRQMAQQCRSGGSHVVIAVQQRRSHPDNNIPFPA